MKDGQCKYQLRFHVCRLEKETESRAASMRTEVEHLVNLRVPEAVRSVMKETMEVKAQFSQLSEHALVLTEENSALRERRSQLSVDVGNLEQMLKEVSRQSCVQKKVTISAHFLYPNRASMSGNCLHIKANSPNFTHGPKGTLTIVFSAFFFHSVRPWSSSRGNISDWSMNWKTVGRNSSSCRPNTEKFWLRWRHTGHLTHVFLVSGRFNAVSSGSSLNIRLIRAFKPPSFFICATFFIQEVLLSDVSQFQKHDSIGTQMFHLQKCR